MGRRSLVWAVAFVLTWVQFARGDTLRLKDGSVIHGTLVSTDDQLVRFWGPGGVELALPAQSVLGVEFEEGTKGTVGTSTAPSPAEPSPAALVSEAVVAIPAGTEVVVRLIDGIDSRRTAVGEVFRASLDDPIVVGNQVVVQRSADAAIQIVHATGSKELFLKLHSLVINGKSHDVVSSYAQVKKRGKGAKAATRAAGLGAIGALIGGLAGGGKGALIGAASGAGLGVMTVAASGSKIQLPPETRLGFQLRAALPIQ